jgi:hypothetical protein
MSRKMTTKTYYHIKVVPTTYESQVQNVTTKTIIVNNVDDIVKRTRGKRIISVRASSSMRSV